MFDLVSAKLAADATRRHMMSARPDAPIVPERPPRLRRAAGPALRRAAGLALRRLAERISPDAGPTTVRLANLHRGAEMNR